MSRLLPSSPMRLRSLRPIASLAAPLLIAAAAFPARADTPADEKIPEDKVTVIEVTYKGNDTVSVGGQQVKATGGTSRYKVYLPPGYHAPENAKAAYPALFLASGGGDPPVESAQAWAKLHGWIVVAVTDAKNGPWNPIFGCTLAAHDDVVRRFRVQEGLKVFGGCSGGAGMAGFTIGARPGFGGWIPMAGGLSNGLEQRRGFVICGIFGTKDDLVPMNIVKHITGGMKGPQHEIWMVPGKTHTFPTADEMARMMDYMEPALLVNSPAKPGWQSARLRLALQAWKDAKEGVARQQAAERVAALAKGARLPKDDPAAADLAAAQAEVKKAATDKQMKAEMDACEAFGDWERALWQQRSRAILGLVPAAQHAALEAALAKKLAAIAKKYPDTEYGRKAKDTPAPSFSP